MLKRKRTDAFSGNELQRTRILSASRDEYTIGWICALPLEMAAAKVMLDTIFPELPNLPNDRNIYTYGSIGVHKIVVSCLPSGVYGTTSAAVIASQMRSSFPSIRFYFMVGIGGGVPSSTADIRLGDIVVSKPSGQSPGVIQYDYGKAVAGSFQRIGVLDKPPLELLTTISKLQANQMTEGSRIPSLLSQVVERYPETAIRFAHPGRQEDQLFESAYNHIGGDTCDHCDSTKLVPRPFVTTNSPTIHYGLIASGNQVMKDGVVRDRIARELDIYCFEMEAAGLMDALPCLVVRGICDYSDSHKNKQWQGYAALTAAAYTKELLYTLPANRKLEIDLEEDPHKPCLESLCFESIDSRFHDIAEAHAETCSWLFENPQFRKWKNGDNVRDYNGVLWIKGKPGAGKSTLMKHALIYCRESFSGCNIAAYFFNARGSLLDKCTTGMLRSLLYQLLERDPQSCDRFMPLFLDKRKKHAGGWEWHPGELKSFFVELVSYCSSPVVLFVDALDECDEAEVRAVVSFLETLALVSTKSGTSLKICLSSRHYPAIAMAKMLELVVEQQDEHNQDITIYVKDKLRIQDKDIVKETLLKADGIFLWVILVTEILNQAFDEGRITLVRERLSQIPGDLDEVFRTLLAKDNQYQDETVLMFQIVLFSRRHLTLTPASLYYAVLAGTNPGGLRRWDQTVITHQTIDRYITSTSRGLIEVRRFKYKDDEVQFIHQTVTDFLLRNRRLQTLDPTLAPDAVGASHERIVRCCLSYLDMQDLNIPSPGYEPEIVLRQEYPFLEYTVNYIFFHIENTGFTDTSQCLSLSELRRNTHLLEKLQTFHDIFTWDKSLHYGAGPNILYALVLDDRLKLAKKFLIDYHEYNNTPGGYYGNPLQAAIYHLRYKDPEDLIGFIKLALSTGADINSQGGLYGTALRAALVVFNKSHQDKGKLKMIRTLLAAGADVNERSGASSNETVLYTQVKASPGLDSFPACPGLEILEMLLEAGADVNAQCGHYGNALQAAFAHLPQLKGIAEAKMALIEMLLKAGANVNAKGGYFGTCLHAAIGYGIKTSNVSAIKMLLDAGADVNAPGGPYKTCLQTAIGFGITPTTLEVIKMLLDAGADVNAQGGHYGACLQAAVGYGITKLTVDVMEMLLAAGTDFNAKAGGYDTLVKAIIPRLYLGDRRFCLTMLGMLRHVGAIGTTEVRQGVNDIYGHGRNIGEIRTDKSDNQPPRRQLLL
ncbi:hypothetical protein TWF694_006295 [Orbilia ellipsospora]|uniref:Nephrocystin 3-like N-terminal domain-containing protein n=1 Tax=Orbilia ellipsospora TaxID=2528407 RepID=A0AAV9XL40_9PEZI